MGDGSTASHGLVEVKAINGSWGGLCDDQFDIHDANVICQMLGFPGAEMVYKGGFDDLATDIFGIDDLVSGTNFAMDDLECTGMESSIHDCVFNEYGNSEEQGMEWNDNCSASENAGLKCIGKGCWNISELC